MKATLEFKNICMEFPGVKALDEMSFKAKNGEVIAFLGENGAGKSTLLKILNGDYHHTSGQIYIDDEEVAFNTPNEAIQAGISVIYQERQLAPYLSVAENIFMGNMPVKGPLIDLKKMNEKAEKIIKEFNLPILPQQKVKNISIAHQQMVEIMKAYNRESKIICFDEPTAALSDSEIISLFKIINKLKQQGKIIIYVSHRMNEIFEVTDKVVVFKDGKFVAMKDTCDTNEKELVKLMVGRDLGDVFNSLDRNKNLGETILELKQVSNEFMKDISFKVKKGEIVGLAGLVGARRTETARAIFGADKITSGEMLLEGKPYQPRTPKDAMDKGIALCPEDRKTQGLVLIRSVRENSSMAIMDRLTKFGFVNFAEEKEFTHKAIKDFNIKTPHMEQKAINLSGGNQQKIILARWMALNPKLLILDEPTKGIDVGAKSEIYNMICEIAKKGVGVIVISSELPEIIGISDRILILKDGSVTGEVSKEEATEEKILAYAMLEEDKE